MRWCSIAFLYLFLSLTLLYSDSPEAATDTRTSGGRGSLTINAEGDTVSVLTQGATLENVFSKLIKEIPLHLYFYCFDPIQKQGMNAYEISGVSVYDLLRQLLSPEGEFVFSDAEGNPLASAENAKNKMVHIYPEGCTDRNLPVRVFRPLRGHPILSRGISQVTGEELAHVLKTEGPAARSRAAYVVGLKGEREGIPFAKEAVSDPSPEVMLAAVSALVRLGIKYGDGDIADVVAERMKENAHPELLMALVQLDKEKAWPFIDKFIDMPSPQGAETAVRALSLTHDRRAITRLERVAQGSNQDAARQAIFAIGEIGGPDAEHALIRFLSDRDDFRNAAAVHAVHFLPENEGAEARNQVRRLVRSATVSDSVLDELAKVSFLEPFESVLADSSIEAPLKIRVLKALGDEGTKKGVDTIAISLNDPDAEVRITAVYALASISMEECIPHLVYAFNDKDPIVRRAVVKAFSGAYADDSILTTLEQGLSDEDDVVRMGSIDAMDNFGPPDERMIALLHTAGENQDPYVAKKALYILQKWGIE